MIEVYILLILSIFFIIFGIKNIIKNSKDNFYYSAINNIVMGLGMVFCCIVFIYYGYNKVILLIGGITFIFGGSYGIYFKKKINNHNSLNIDIFAFIGGVIALIGYYLI